jgi:hypothetical protein
LNAKLVGHRPSLERRSEESVTLHSGLDAMPPHGMRFAGYRRMSEFGFEVFAGFSFTGRVSSHEKIHSWSIPVVMLVAFGSCGVRWIGEKELLTRAEQIPKNGTENP